jgi:hypothetical protein
MNFIEFQHKDPRGKSDTCETCKQTFVSWLSPLAFVKMVNKTTVNIHDDNVKQSLSPQASRGNSKQWCNTDA